MKRVQKVVAYITCNNKLLVFKHRDYPEVGVQVPAGTVDNPADLENEALREATEETGLSGFKVVKYLGTQDFDASQFRPEMHERHFFHLSIEADTDKEWLHYEEHPTGGGAPIAYQCYWADLKTADLFAQQGSMLDKIRKSPQPHAKSKP